jgi:hypothetical protein
MQVRVADDVVWCPGEGELVVFSAANDVYCGLDEVAARIWTRLSEGADQDAVVETLLAEFEVDRETAGSAVKALLAYLIDQRLLVGD